jgi:putative endonuclease
MADSTNASNPYLQGLSESQIAAIDKAMQIRKENFYSYLMAYAKRKEFYIDCTRDFDSIWSAKSAIHLEQERTLGKDNMKPLLIVWYESFSSEAQARARCAEIKAMPHAWQRRLVDSSNPDWVDLWDEVTGYPFAAYRVDEEGLVRIEERA